MKSLAVTTAFLLAAVLWLVYPGGPIVASTGMPPDAASLVERVLPPGWKLYSTYTEGDEITVCLDLPFADLRAGDGMGIEAAVEIVCGALTELDWRRLEVQAVDPDSGGCRSISDYAPRVGSIGRPLVTSDQQPSAMGADVASGALAGKTVYLSAGHGWEWTGSAWRTQRVPYQGFIEDHNNAEVVDQYLIRYLENAGAQVIPVRERDWSAQRAIVNNDQGVPYYTETGVWTTGVSAGYEGTDRYAISVLAPATATATWSVSVPADGSYAVYAWVRPGPNRVPDAHYRVFHAAGSTDVVLDQRIHPQTWRYLGTFSFRSGTAQIVLDNSSFASGAAVMADAIRLGGGLFDSLSGIETTATSAPYKPWWESATFYYSQWMGLDPAEWECYNRDEETQECDFNDVVARPMYSRWQHSGTGQDAVYISWHTNGYDGNVRGTTSYIHNGDTYPVTEGSPELAAAVHTELVSDIRAGWDPQWADRGVGQLNLGELRLLWDDDPATRMPGALLEIAFHDNPDDANALKDPRFGQLSARAIYQGIVKYFENRDHVNLVLAPEPPTHVSARNLGSSRVRVDWVASPVDAVGLRGEAATGYRVYTSPDGLAWALAAIAADTEATLGPLTAGQKLYVRVSATNAGGESLPTEALGVRVGETAPILIVNGFDKLNRFELVSQYDPTMGWNLRMWLDQINRRAYVIHHGDAIPAEYAWDSASNEAVADGLVDPRLYGVVDWILGEEATEEEGTLSYAERAVIQAYLDANRALLISGAEMAWDLEGMGRAPAFLNETLHTDYVADDALTYAVAPVAGGAFAGLPAFGFDAPGEYDVGYPDVLGGLSGATPSLTYSGGTGGAAALQYAAGCRRLLVFGFPFETIRPAMRGPVMASALAYLGVCALTETTITAPVPGTYYSSTPAFAGTAVGVGLSRVEVLVRRGTDGYYWNGASWVSSPVWVVATGASSWSYPLPALSDGSYTVQARAVGYSTDLTPALVMFGVDSVAPGTPTPISPAGGVTLLSPSVTLSWSQPPDTGSPLRYRIEVNSRVYVAPASPYQVGLPSGEYAWRLRAEDSAGNASAWSASAAFAVEVQEAYLPLLMRGR